MASSFEKKATKGKSCISSSAEKWFGKEVQGKDQTGVTNAGQTSHLESIRSSKGHSKEDRNDVVLWKMQTSEQSNASGTPYLWRSLDQSLAPIDQIQEPQTSSSQGQTGGKTKETAEATDRSFIARLDALSGEGSVGAIDTSRKTSSQDVRGADQGLRGFCSSIGTATSTAADLAATTWRTKGGRADHGRRAEAVGTSDRSSEGRHDFNWPNAGGEGEIGDSIQRIDAEVTQSQPPEPPQQGRGKSHESQSAHLGAGQRMGEVCHKYHPEDPISHCDVSTIERGTHGNLQCQIGRTSQNSTRSGCCIQDSFGAEGRADRSFFANSVPNGFAEYTHSALHPATHLDRRGRRDGSPRRLRWGGKGCSRGTNSSSQTDTEYDLQRIAIANQGGDVASETEGQWQGQGQGQGTQHCARLRDISALRDGQNFDQLQVPCGSSFADLARRSQPKVSFDEDVEIFVYSSEVVVHRIARSDIVSGWCRTLWHLHGQNGVQDSVLEASAAPNFLMPSLFQDQESSQDNCPEQCVITEFQVLQHAAQDSPVPEGSQVSHDGKHQTESQTSRTSNKRVFEVWFLRTDHFHLCIQSRKIVVPESDDEETLKHACMTAWYDLLGPEECKVLWIVPKPGGLSTVRAHLILMQGPERNSKAVMMHTDILPPLRRQRVALVPDHSTVEQCFQAFQLGFACDRPAVSCVLRFLSPWPDYTYYDQDRPHLTSSQLIEGLLFAIDVEGSSESDSTNSSVGADSTAVPSEHEASDEDSESEQETEDSSFVSGVPSMRFREFERRYPWEWTHHADHQPEQDDDLITEYDLSPDLQQIQDFISEAATTNHESPVQVVTYGVGLVTLGRRDFHVDTVEELTVEMIFQEVMQLWNDHVQNGDVSIYYVNPQPGMLDNTRQEVVLVLIVAINYQAALENQKAVLVRQRKLQEGYRDTRVYAARLDARITSFGVLTALGLDDEVFPNGVREHYVTLQGRRMPYRTACDVQDGDLCEILIGTYPTHIRNTAQTLWNTEKFFRDMRAVQENLQLSRAYSLDVVHCRFHGSSPMNQPMGSRDLYIPAANFFSMIWIQEAAQLWPFQENQGNFQLIYVDVDDPTFTTNDAQEHCFHFIVSYAVDPERVPVLIRQTIAAIDEQAHHSEEWAIDLHALINEGDLFQLLDQGKFWTFNDLQPLIHRLVRTDEWKRGEILDIQIMVQDRHHLLAVMLEIAQRQKQHQEDNQHVEATSLIQKNAQKRSISVFEEICLDLKKQQQDDPPTETPISDIDPNAEDNSDLPWISEPDRIQIAQLRTILQEMKN